MQEALNRQKGLVAQEILHKTAANVMNLVNSRQLTNIDLISKQVDRPGTSLGYMNRICIHVRNNI